MMYLSTLLIDVGTNPDRPRPGRLWLRNLYHVHQRLCMAFPSQAREKDDPNFLHPFKECDFPLLRNPNAVPADPRHSFLFRIDNSIKDNIPRTIIIVQSEERPNWDYAFGLKPGLIDPRTNRPIGNAGHFLAAPPQVREYNTTFAEGGEFQFRIRVNLSKKSKKSKDGTDLRKHREGTDGKGRQKDQSKRVSLTWNEEKKQKPEDVIIPWFANKGMVTLKGEMEKRQAFQLHSCNVLNLGWVVANKPDRRMKFRSALIEGTLTVNDAPAFKQAIETGLGSGKAFGFGLLSLGRLGP